jgi:hypothetical protein
MTHATRSTSSGFSQFTFSVTARKIAQGALAMVLALVLLGNVAFAQYYEEEPVTIVPRTQQSSGQSAKPVDSTDLAQASQQPAASPQSQPADSTFVLPPGTGLPLGLVRPLTLKSSSAKGAGVYLQVTFPITVAGRMVVPPGAYVQGTIESMRTNRGSDPDLEFELRSANLIFSTGYTVPLAGTVHMVHKYARLAPGSPESGQSTMALIPVGKSNVPSPVMAATGTPTLPPLPPLPSMNGARTAIIAVGVASAAAIVVLSAIAISHHNDVYLEAGTPLEIILAEPLQLDANSVTNAVQQYSARMTTNPPDIVKPPEKMCYDPGTSGTPDTVIPGTPPSPPTVIPGVNGAPDTVIPGSPGTPDTVIPGTPGTPGSWHKCPIFK